MIVDIQRSLNSGEETLFPLGISTQASASAFDVLKCTDALINTQTNMAAHYWISSADSLSVIVRHFTHLARNLQARDSE